MKLYVRSITIEKGEQTAENFDFNKGLSVVRGSADLYDIIKLLLGKNEESRRSYDIRLSAITELDRVYHINGSKKKGERFFTVSVHGEDENDDCTKEYFKAIHQNEEMDSSLFFHQFKHRDYPHKLFHYKNPINYYLDEDFGTLTNGYGTLRCFRGFITDYIKNFKPIKLCENKDYFLTLSDSGKFEVCLSDKGEKVYLNESENVLYRYLSFISIADFWDKAEKIRNMNRIKKPLVVSSLLENINEKSDIRDILKKTSLLDRQTILCVEEGTYLPNTT